MPSWNPFRKSRAAKRRRTSKSPFPRPRYPLVLEQLEYRWYPGDVLTCRAKLTKVTRAGHETDVECDAWVENQAGQKVIVGSAAATLPA